MHPIAVQFFKEISNKRTIFLLQSVWKEYNRKIRNLRESFEVKMYKELREKDELPLEEVKQKFLNAQDNKDYNFEKYLFEKFEEKEFHIVDRAKLMKILSSFMSDMRAYFNQLTTHWIVRPKINDYQKVQNDPIYLNYLHRIGNNLHIPDNWHLALACYIITDRPGDHDYFFYTDDDEFFRNHLEQRVNVENLKIKKLPYEILYKLQFDKETNSFSKRVEEGLKFIKDDDLK